MGGVADLSGGEGGAVDFAKIGRVGSRFSAGTSWDSWSTVGEGAASPGVGATITSLGWDSWGSWDVFSQWVSSGGLLNGSGGDRGDKGNNGGEFHFDLIIIYY